MRISDWSSDVCSSDLAALARLAGQYAFDIADAEHLPGAEYRGEEFSRRLGRVDRGGRIEAIVAIAAGRRRGLAEMPEQDRAAARSEEHTSELQSLMRISYAVFCLKKKT